MEESPLDKIKMMTAHEVSAFLRLPMTTVYEMTSKGKLAGVKCGRQWRYLESDLLNFLRKNRTQKDSFPWGINGCNGAGAYRSIGVQTEKQGGIANGSHL